MILPLEYGGSNLHRHSTRPGRLNLLTSQFMGTGCQGCSIDAENGRRILCFDNWPKEIGSGLGNGEDAAECL